MCRLLKYRLLKYRPLTLTVLVIAALTMVTPAEAQFDPVVNTTFTNLNAGGVSGYTQTIVFQEDQEGPAGFCVTFDKGSYDLSGIAVARRLGEDAGGVAQKERAGGDVDTAATLLHSFHRLQSKRDFMAYPLYISYTKT